MDGAVAHLVQTNFLHSCLNCSGALSEQRGPEVSALTVVIGKVAIVTACARSFPESASLHLRHTALAAATSLGVSSFKTSASTAIGSIASPGSSSAPIAAAIPHTPSQLLRKIKDGAFRAPVAGNRGFQPPARLQLKWS